MYALERLTFCGMPHNTRHQWERLALCNSRVPLDKVRAGQPQPANWRIVFVPGTMESAIRQMGKTA